MGKLTLDKPKHKIYLGSKVTFYWNKKKNVLEIETRDPHTEGGPFVIEIPIKSVHKFSPVVRKKGEKLKEVAKRKPKKVKLF